MQSKLSNAIDSHLFCQLIDHMNRMTDFFSRMKYYCQRMSSSQSHLARTGSVEEEETEKIRDCKGHIRNVVIRLNAVFQLLNNRDDENRSWISCFGFTVRKEFTSNLKMARNYIFGMIIDFKFGESIGTYLVSHQSYYCILKFFQVSLVTTLFCRY